MSSSITRETVIQAQRELCKADLAEYTKRSWHVLEPSTPLVWGWAMDAICMHLQAVGDGRIQKLMINCPPGFLKSLLTCVFLPSWIWGPLGQPSKRFMGTAYEERLATRDSNRMRSLVKSPWFQERWPINFTKDTDGKSEFSNDQTGFRLARSFYSTMGKRADGLMLDDPLNIAKANSATELKNCEREFLEALPSRLNDLGVSFTIVIMQRLNERDPSGIIIENNMPYEKLILPMRFDPTLECKTSLGWTDPRTEEGELLFPERYPEHVVIEWEKSLGDYGTASQLQQRPAPRGGGIIKKKWFRWYGDMDLPRILYRYIFADTANKTETQHDFSVLQCWGMVDTGQIILLDQERGKWEAPDLEKKAREFWAKHKAKVGIGPLRKKYVEDKSSGIGLIQALRKPRVDSNGVILPAIPIEGIPRDKDKISRAYSAAPQIQLGNVILPKDAEWIEDFLKEVKNFPTAKHDDQLDPMLDAVDKMLIGAIRPGPPVIPADSKHKPYVFYD